MGVAHSNLEMAEFISVKVLITDLRETMGEWKIREGFSQPIASIAHRQPDRVSTALWEVRKPRVICLIAMRDRPQIKRTAAIISAISYSRTFGRTQLKHDSLTLANTESFLSVY